MNRRQRVAHVVAFVVIGACALAVAAVAQDGENVIGLRGAPGPGSHVAAGGQVRPAAGEATARDGAAPAATTTTRDPQIVICSDGFINGVGEIAYNEESDEFMVGWTTIQNQWSTDIWARRLAPDGTLSGTFCVAAVAGEQLVGPEIAYCPAHEDYLFAYNNLYENTGDRADVQARLVAWNGGWMGDVFTITPEVARHVYPSIAYCAPCDEYVVTYTNEWPTAEIDVYARRVRAVDGVLLDMNVLAPGEGWDRGYSDVAFHPAMYNGEGGYLIAYWAGGPGPEWRIRYKVTHTELDDLYENPELEAGTGHAAPYPKLDAGELGFLVTWYESAGGGYQVRARRISAEGVALGPPEGIPVSGVYTGNPITDGLALTYAFRQRFLVLWSVQTQSGIYDIHGALVSEESDSTISEVFALGNGVEDILYPTASCSPSSVCLVGYTWLNGSNWDIAGQILDLLTVFSDGFEAGDTSAWSATVP